MSYKFSRGYQIIGDLSGSDDANRDTGIDFEENEIKLVAGGTEVFKVSGSHVYIADGSDLVNNGGRKTNLFYVSSTPYSVTTNNHMLAVNTDSAKTLNLPSISNEDAGFVLIVMDGFGGSDNAGANNNNITISAASGQYIGAASSYTINTMGGSVSLVALDSNGWVIFNKITS